MLEPLCELVIINYSSGGDSGDTLLLSTTSHKEVAGRWGSASSPRLLQQDEREWPEAAPGEAQVGYEEMFLLRVVLQWHS